MCVSALLAVSDDHLGSREDWRLRRPGARSSAERSATPAPARGLRDAPRWRERNKAIEASVKARAAAQNELSQKQRAVVQILDGFGLDASLKVLGGCLVLART